MSKKEYIDQLKKQLDEIDIRWQHLLNEQIMIGEDFRSRAFNNLDYSTSLEKKIEELNELLKKKDDVVDEKDMEMVVLQRQIDMNAMQAEEHLNHFDNMRTNRDNLQLKLEEEEAKVVEKEFEIEKIHEEHAEKERARRDNLVEAGTMTFITKDSSVFDKKSPRGAGAQSGVGLNEM